MAGGTAQALRIAIDTRIPIINLESYGPIGWRAAVDLFEQIVQRNTDSMCRVDES